MTTQTGSKKATDVAGRVEKLLEGPILDAIKRSGTTDVHVNPGGGAFASSSEGRESLGEVDRSVIERVLRVIADSRGGELKADRLFKAELPEGEPFRGARVQAVLPPLVGSPAVSFRMQSKRVFELEEFRGEEGAPVEASRKGSGTRSVISRVLEAVVALENVLVFGGTSTGKTSLLNAALKAAAATRPTERVLVLEDTFELQVAHLDQVAMRTEDRLGVGLHELVKASLRMEPDRIVVGEVRGGEALDLIDAWSTGHEGGFASVHATSARGALERLEHLAGRHPEGSQGASLKWYVASAVDVVVGMRRGKRRPWVAEIHRVGLDSSGNYELQEY